MATAAHTIMAPVAATPVLTLVSNRPAPTAWHDSADVRAVAGMINTCNAMTSTLDTIAGRGGELRNAHTIGGKLGTVRVRREMAFAARQWQPVQEPTDGDTVIGALWDELDSARSAWIKARLADDGLADVWTRTGATDDEYMRAHERERELEDQAPTVADVVSRQPGPSLH